MGLVRLPPEYQEVEYLESTGTQFIQTNYFPKQYDEITCDFSTSVFTSGSTFWTLLSAGTGTDQLIVLLANNTTGSAPAVGAYYKYFASGNATKFNFYPTINKKYRLHIGADGSISCNGYTASSSYKGSVNTNLFLMMRANNSSPFKGKIFSFKVENDGQKELDLVPCYRKSDNEIGMYDLVTGSFFTNAGTGSFVAGRDVKVTDLTESRRRILLNTPHRETATGEVVTFQTDMRAPLKVSIPFSPIQDTSGGDPSPEHECPISGWTGVNINSRGKNMLDPNAPRSKGNFTSDGNIGSASSTYVFGIPVDSNATYTLYTAGSAQFRVGLTNTYPAAGVYCNYLATRSANATPYVINTGAYKYIALATTASVATVAKAMIIKGNNTTANFEEYRGKSIQIAFTDPSTGDPLTLYGGTLTINEDGTGKITDMFKALNLGNLSWKADTAGGNNHLFYCNTLFDSLGIISSTQNKCSVLTPVGTQTLSSWRTSTTSSDNKIGKGSERLYVKPTGITSVSGLSSLLSGQYYVARRSSNVTYTLTAQEVGQLLSQIGTNNLWSDLNGNPTVKYWKH